MMERALRLRRPAEFARVRSEGRTWSHPLVVLGAARNGLEHDRFGFVTSKRLGTAVTRNRLRRQCREAVRSIRPRIRPGWDMVFIIRQGMVGRPYDQIVGAVTEVCRRAGLLQDLV